MKILLDHCIDWRLSNSLPSHAVSSAREMGWETLRNGELLSLAEKEFYVLITVDQNIPSQQQPREIMVLVLVAFNNRLATLVPMVPQIEQAIANMRPGEFVTLYKE